MVLVSRPLMDCSAPCSTHNLQYVTRCAVRRCRRFGSRQMIAAGRQSVCHTPQHSLDRLDVSRRSVLSSASALAVLIAKACTAPAASAAELGSLARFLQSRQEKYALAPIGVGKHKLSEAAKLLSEANTAESRAAALKIIRFSSFNCYVYEEAGFDSLESTASLIQQGFPAFVDPCTYRLIAKNVTKLVPSKDQRLVQETTDSLEQLLRSYHLLDEALERSEDDDESMRTKVLERMSTLQKSLLRFENSIRACLRMEVAEI